MNQDNPNVLNQFAAQIGELAQHEVSDDPNALKTSDWYLSILKGVLERNFDFDKNQTPRYLEVASYRHIMGYELASEYEFESTLFDISARDLLIGREQALSRGLKDTVDRVAGDFHDLPFSDNYFDLAYISASLHHTLQPENIISEMMRVLKPGGFFYCQREPAERLFCFYLFNANRPAQYTPMEAKLAERGTLRLFSSPFHGARNADVFARIENDRIPLDYYYQVFSKYGHVVEQALYHDGLLTRLDKEILEQEELTVNALTEFIYDNLMLEVGIMESHIGAREILLGYKAPTSVSVMGMARRVANALKARPEDKSSVEWQQAMTRIFGGSLRFLIRRADANIKKNTAKNNSKYHSLARLKNIFRKPDLENKEPPNISAEKFRRTCRDDGLVKYDQKVHEDSALKLWEKLLPDIQTAKAEELFGAAFVKTDWEFGKTVSAGSPIQLNGMTSLADIPELWINTEASTVLVMRYEILLDESLVAANLQVSINGENVERVYIPQTEARMMRLILNNGTSSIKFTLTDLGGKSVSANTRIVISILQCIPINTNRI